MEKGLILVYEDESYVQRLVMLTIGKALEGTEFEDCEVAIFEDENEAIGLIKESGENILAVIADGNCQRRPSFNGTHVVSAALEQGIGQEKVILHSAETSSMLRALAQFAEVTESMHVVAKPAPVEELVASIREALGISEDSAT